jgi:hypothetical protein
MMPVFLNESSFRIACSVAFQYLLLVIETTTWK